MSDDAAPRARRRIRWAVALLLVGLLGAVVPALVAGPRFLSSASVYPLADGRVIVIAGFAGRGGPGPWVPIHYQVTGDRVSAEVEGGVLTIRARGTITVTSSPSAWTSAADLVTHEPGWTAAAVAIALTPLLFVWWRRSGAGVPRATGIACCVAASAAVCAFVLTRPANDVVSPGWVWCTVPAGAALMVAAFAVAPPPRMRDE